MEAKEGGLEELEKLETGATELRETPDAIFDLRGHLELTYKGSCLSIKIDETLTDE
jgi:hypothetical protein